MRLADWAERLEEPSPSEAVRVPHRTYAATWRRLVELGVEAIWIGSSCAGEPLWALPLRTCL